MEGGCRKGLGGNIEYGGWNGMGSRLNGFGGSPGIGGKKVCWGTTPFDNSDVSKGSSVAGLKCGIPGVGVENSLELISLEL